VQRGNNKGACFYADSDYLCYLTILQGLSVKHACPVHAYCLMTNHVHLLLTPSEANGCTNLMRDLGQSYVQYFNRRHGRTGTLWEGRFRSCVVESAEYVLACYRYIELNPVRAGMVSDPRDYPWSSHGENCGRIVSSRVTPHAEFLALGTAAYERLFESAMDNSILGAIRHATNGNLPLGSEAFKAGILASGRKIEHGRPGRPIDSDNSEGAQLEIGL